MYFNYQVVFSFDDSNQVVFVGKTDESVADLYERLTDSIEAIELPGFEIVNFVYQPSKTLENETSKKE